MLNSFALYYRIFIDLTQFSFYSLCWLFLVLTEFVCLFPLKYKQTKILSSSIKLGMSADVVASVLLNQHNQANSWPAVTFLIFRSLCQVLRNQEEGIRSTKIVAKCSLESTKHKKNCRLDRKTSSTTMKLCRP